MSFCWTTINVNNMDESLNFYQNIVGLPLNSRFQPNPAMELAFLGEGETKVELICNAGADETKVAIGADISLGFFVPSVDEKLQFLNDKGVKIHSGPFTPGPHIKFFYVQDPNGLKIQFVERI